MGVDSEVSKVQCATAGGLVMASRTAACISIWPCAKSDEHVSRGSVHRCLK